MSPRRASSETSSVSTSSATRSRLQSESPNVVPQDVKAISASRSQSWPGRSLTQPGSVSAHGERRRKKPRTETDSGNGDSIDDLVDRTSGGHGTSSTESVSSSARRLYGTFGVEARQSKQVETGSIIDLTGPDRHSSAVYARARDRKVLVRSPRPRASPVANCADSATILQQDHHQVRLLPAEARAPYPNGGQSQFTTHITETLKRLTHGEAPALKHFRPAFVCRDVKVLERGYWQFYIKIAEESVVKESRRPRVTLNLLGSTARKKRGGGAGVLASKTSNHALWTEDEFIQFWENMTSVIESGKVGFATRMTRELDGGSLWKIRVFTWGEMLGHIWMLFLVLSDRLTGNMLMEWIAGNGAVVVRMSDGKHQSGLWMRKGSEGAQGVWGLAYR
ncbi:hypothetical protein AYO21_00176 [Fonsecaea monophora]|uniref:Uncharacterized protein n=1 Tax=Fonsecaea monophora TaxID=254056 RepID=A0A177FPT3_9EURO|nr:hypothetical protein AYO21_00176 [Fonsecaea monophora]KAH0842200.1 hypothetical protein FOPE_07498 [Fonsecaea pedrosoi]OAG45540.1 hypothetical protein AYO21_00176 [Fonsecaea monophora]